MMTEAMKKTVLMTLLNFVLCLFGVVVVSHVFQGVPLMTAFCAPYTWFLVVSATFVTFISMSLKGRERNDE